MLISHNSKSKKREIKRGGGGGGGGDAVAVGKKNENGGFRERVSDFSLEIRAIQLSAVFGTRPRRGLRVGTRFREFPQTSRGKGFSLLGFIPSFKHFVNV